MKKIKTSNKLIIIALLVILVSLVAYDFLLKAEYTSGSYKIPFRNYVTLKWKDFDIVDIKASTVANVKFVQGPFSVRVEQYAAEYIQIHQKGNRLEIDAIFEDHYRGNPHEYLLLISCPKLTEVYANATYRADNRQVTDTIVREDWNMRQVLIDGFKQDTLSIVQDYGSTILLANNDIRSIHGIVGKNEGSGSKIILRESNQFRDVNLDIGHTSKLVLENAIIHNLSFRLADSAKLILSGNAQDLFNNSKRYRK